MGAKQAFNPIGACGTSRSASRLFNGRSSGSGSGLSAPSGGLSGGGAPQGAGAVLEPVVIAAVPLPEGTDALLEETDEELNKDTASCSGASSGVRRNPSKGSSSSGASGPSGVSGPSGASAASGVSCRTVRPAPATDPGSAPGAAPSSDMLRRLSRDELLALFRCPESELRDNLLKAITERDLTDPP